MKIVSKYKNCLLFIIVTLLAIFIRELLFNFQSIDYNVFLSEWFDYLKNNGGIFAIPSYSGDYTGPYIFILALLTYLPIKSLYSIKIVSLIFDIFMAIAGSLLVKELLKKKKHNVEKITLIIYTVLLFIPQVIMNSSMWGQCDSIYTTFCLLSIYFLVKNKLISSFIFLGIAFSFKLQTIFLLPLFVILFFAKAKNIKIYYFLLIPLMIIIMNLPCIIFGKSTLDCFLVYFIQTTEWSNYLTLNFPNIYTFFDPKNAYIANIGIFVTFIILLIALIYILRFKIKFNEEKIITLTLWILIVVTFCLPRMHERYLFLGEILAVIYYVVYRKNLITVLFINIMTIITYLNYFNFIDISLNGLALGYLFIIIYFTNFTFKFLRDKVQKARKRLN